MGLPVPVRDELKAECVSMSGSFLTTLIFSVCISPYWSWDIPIITSIPLNFLGGALLEFSVSPFHYPAMNIPIPHLFFILGLEFHESVRFP